MACIEDLDKYVEESEFVLHNGETTLSIGEASKKMPTLQLIKTEEFRIEQAPNSKKNELKLRG